MFFLGKIAARLPNLPAFPSNVEYGDIVKGLPVSPGLCVAIYASHVLEHLSLSDFRTAIAHTFSYLAEGGIFRLVMPDLEQLAQTYLTSNQPSAALIFMERSGLGEKVRSQNFIGRLRDVLGNSSHRWLWDYKSVKDELSAVGFNNIRRAEYGDSEQALFLDVEESGRWQDCLGVECRRLAK
jgi:predicted SAM-dependent methyltransferase